jgi:tripartite-type tricarboxylate transporter receptor subunit TctC
LLIALSASSLLALAGGAAVAQLFPSRPLRLVVPIAPGGINDAVGRILANGLSEALGQPVAVENRSGGGGVVGTDYVAKAPRDGHTLLISDSAIVVNPSLQSGLPYDIFADLQIIGLVSSSPLVVAVGPGLPVSSIADLIALGKSRAEPLTFASPGAGTMTHLAAELFGQRFGLRLTAVPYRGVAASFPDIIAGRVDFIFSSIAGAGGLIADGRLRGLATTGEVRAAALPALPTMAQAGMSDFEVEIWMGLFAPSGMPEAIVRSLRAALEGALRDPRTTEALAGVGNSVMLRSREEASAFLGAEYERWRSVAGGQSGVPR